ncbi:MAG: tripartite tricarboxylate transporter TctB family protein [Alphaproteobacteria bacterium]|nr:tripartite tricarboxylate transporter TctB family protein [Alphaproteobacteria bacterium]
MRFNNAVLGGLLLAGAIAIVVTASGFPNVPGQQFGPRHFPYLIAGGFGVCGALLVAQGLATRRATGEAWVRLGDWMTSPRHLLNVGVVLGAMLVYWWAAPVLGFIPTAFILLAVMMRWLGAGWLGAVCVAAATTAMIHISFYSWLRVSLPLGLMRDVLYP